MTKIISNPQEAQVSISSADLKTLGKGEVAYIRKYRMKGEPAFVLHAADGTAISVQKDVTGARITAQQQDLDIVPVH